MSTGVSSVDQPVVQSGLAGLVWPVLAIVCLAALLQLPFPVNHDAAWIVMGADRMLDGARFGRDVIDVNPPLAWWLSMPAALLHRLTGLDLAVAFQAYVLAVGIGSLLLSWRLLQLLRLSTAQLRIVIPIVGYALLVLPAYDFGQREHFLLLFSLPYILLGAARLAECPIDARMAATIGLLGALGLCLKPHFLLLPVFLAYYAIYRKRSIRPILQPENYALALTGIVYLGCVLRFAPAYVSVIVPETMISYDAYGKGFWRTFWSYLIVLTPLIAVSLALPKLIRDNDQSGLREIMLVAAAALALAAQVQEKGWAYHILPAFGFMLIAVSVPLGAIKEIAGGRFVLGLYLLFAAISSLHPVYTHVVDLATDSKNHSVTRGLSNELVQHSMPRKVFAFVTSPRNVHPAILESGAQWSGKTCCMYLLPAHIRDARSANDDPVRSAARREAALKQVEDVLDQLIKDPPQSIFIDTKERKLGFDGMPFSYLDWLNTNPKFRELWNSYRESKPTGHFRIFVHTP